MNRGIKLGLIILSLIFVLISVLGCSKHHNTVLLVYGISAHPEPFFADFSLSEALEVAHKAIEEGIIITQAGGGIYTVSSDDAASYHLILDRGVWKLFHSAEIVEERLADIESVHLKSLYYPQGVFHLNDLEMVTFYDSYDHLAAQNQGRVGYQRVSLTTESVLLVFRDGEERAIAFNDREIHLEMKRGSWCFEHKPLAVIWENPPEQSAFKIHDLILKRQQKAPLLVIFVDGLGFINLQRYLNEVSASFWTELEVQPMRAAYPPRTMVNYPLFAIGKHPDSSEEQIHLFGQLSLNGTKGVIIEGESMLFPTDLEVVLNTVDAEMGLDENIFLTAVDSISRGYDFVFIHFHDIDDFGHRWGVNHTETRSKLEAAGGYITKLIKLWHGEVIIISDHGMHDYFDSETKRVAGKHDCGRVEDIIAIFSHFVTDESSFQKLEKIDRVLQR